MDQPRSGDGSPLDLQMLWAKYEDIAMHFNDLLMRLRAQSLAGIAALSTIVGVLAKDAIGGVSVSWGVAAGIFGAMALFWIAIWCLDFLYYNRLLRGAVAALAQIEIDSKTPAGPTSGINMSTLIEEEFKKPFFRGDLWHFRGVLFFYGVVLFSILAGVGFSLYMEWRPPEEPDHFTFWCWRYPLLCGLSS